MALGIVAMGILALGIMALGILALGVMALGRLSFSHSSDVSIEEQAVVFKSFIGCDFQWPSA